MSALRESGGRFRFGNFLEGDSSSSPWVPYSATLGKKDTVNYSLFTLRAVFNGGDFC
jgi:hypothetical protein